MKALDDQISQIPSYLISTAWYTVPLQMPSAYLDFFKKKYINWTLAKLRSWLLITQLKYHFDFLFFVFWKVINYIIIRIFLTHFPSRKVQCEDIYIM